MKNKIFSLLGFATKAGKLGFGFEAAVSALKANRSRLIVIAEDISAKSCKEIEFYAKSSKVKHIILNGITIKDMSDATGRRCGIISVNDNGFADALLKVC